MGLEIIKAGLLDSIQDKGRYGCQHLGINPSGSMDLFSAELANMLVANDVNSPVIELHFPSSIFKFTNNHVIALTGADFEPEIDGKPVPNNQTIAVSKGQILVFKKYNNGARAYLAISGKWQLDMWLNSYSTNLKAQAGGYNGRALLKNDILEIEDVTWKFETEALTVILPVKTTGNNFFSNKIIRCTTGAEFIWMTDESKNNFSKQTFTITAQSDRMGYRLNSEPIKLNIVEQLLSTAVTGGTVQCLPSGQLVILMADHQTTGGYPKVANVITADLPKLAQIRTHDKINFQFISLPEAESALLKQHQFLQSEHRKIQEQLKKIMDEGN